MNDKKQLSLFGKKLRELREKKNLTQAELAELVGFSPNFIGMIERGERNTNVSNVFKLAKALNVHPKEFFDF